MSAAAFTRRTTSWTPTMTAVGSGRATTAKQMINILPDVAAIAAYLELEETDTAGLSRGDLETAFIRGREQAHRHGRLIEPADIAEQLPAIRARNAGRSFPQTTTQTHFLDTSALPPRRVVHVGKSTVMDEYAAYFGRPNQFILGENTRNLLTEGTENDV